MNTEQVKPQGKVAGTLLFLSVILLTLPATFYGVVSLYPSSAPGWISRWIDRGSNLHGISDVIFFFWFVVLLGGRYLVLVAFLLNIFLLFRREIALWLKVLASALLVFAILGVLLVESQANHVRH